MICEKRCIIHRQSQMTKNRNSTMILRWEDRRVECKTLLFHRRSSIYQMMYCDLHKKKKLSLLKTGKYRKVWSENSKNIHNSSKIWFLLLMCFIFHYAVPCLVAQSCLTLCYPMDCSLPSSSVHGDSPGKNTGVGGLSLLQRIFTTQE